MLRGGKYWRHVTISDHCGCTCYWPTFCKKKNNHFDNSVDYVQILLCIENQWKFVSRNQRSISIHVHMLFTYHISLASHHKKQSICCLNTNCLNFSREYWYWYTLFHIQLLCVSQSNPIPSKHSRSSPLLSQNPSSSPLLISQYEKRLLAAKQLGKLPPPNYMDIPWVYICIFFKVRLKFHLKYTYI